MEPLRNTIKPLRNTIEPLRNTIEPLRNTIESADNPEVKNEKKILTKQDVLARIKAIDDYDGDETSLSFRNGGYTGIAPDAFFGLGIEIECLDLGGNKITELPKDVFNGIGKKLRVLNLNNNKLSELPKGVFDKCRKLDALYIENNKLSELPKGVFDQCKKFRRFYASNNEITELPKDMLNGCQVLECVDLSLNNITEIPEGALDKCYSLKSLDLSNNRIKEIGRNTFPSQLGSLEFLDLHGNAIHTLDSRAFGTLNNLVKLDLHSNNISTLPKGVFKKFKNLKNIRLSNNDIGAIDKEILAGLTKLTVLDLSYNAIEVIPENVLDGVEKLDNFILDYNKVHTIDPYAFSENNKPRILSVCGNRITYIHDSILKPNMIDPQYKTKITIDVRYNHLSDDFLDYLTENEYTMRAVIERDNSVRARQISRFKTMFGNELYAKVKKFRGEAPDICNAFIRIPDLKVAQNPGNREQIIEMMEMVLALKDKDIITQLNGIMKSYNNTATFGFVELWLFIWFLDAGINDMNLSRLIKLFGPEFILKMAKRFVNDKAEFEEGDVIEAVLGLLNIAAECIDITSPFSDMYFGAGILNMGTPEIDELRKQFLATLGLSEENTREQNEANFNKNVLEYLVLRDREPKIPIIQEISTRVQKEMVDDKGELSVKRNPGETDFQYKERVSDEKTRLIIEILKESLKESDIKQHGNEPDMNRPDSRIIPQVNQESQGIVPPQQAPNQAINQAAQNPGQIYGNPYPSALPNNSSGLQASNPFHNPNNLGSSGNLPPKQL